MAHTTNGVKQHTSDVLVVGAGISGLSTALETAETGFSVALVEKNPYIGGRVSQLNNYFPKMCPPTCGLEINIRRLRENQGIKLFTQAEIQSVEGSVGNFTVLVRLNPRYINNRCTNCGDCVDACPEMRLNDFNFGLDQTKAIYSPYNNAYPAKYVIDGKACKFENCRKCVDICRYNAIDLTEKPEMLELHVKSIVWATGWNPYDAGNLETLGYKKYKNVITNIEMERLASPSGPTGGIIQVPGSDMEINKVAFIQCAGSRDENHLEYCSSVCCLASLKQARYVREQLPQADIHVFYIDIRSPGVFEEFYTDSKKDEKLFFHRGKGAKVFSKNGNGKLIVEAENTIENKLKQMEFDLVVLATGMKPATEIADKVSHGLLDRNGFFKSEINGGMAACGVCNLPKDVAASVQDSTAAAIKAIHTIMGAK